MGSSLFTVKPPVANLLWEANIPTISESPYVVSYKEADYLRIKEIKSREEHALENYIFSQPEFQEPTFQAQLQEAFEIAENDPSQSVVYIWELTKYRLNKIIPDSLSFEERIF